MNKKTVLNELLLLVGTAIWGAAFIFQDIGSKYLDAFSFCVARNIIGTIALFIASLIFMKADRKRHPEELTFKDGKLWLYALLIAVFTAGGMGFQQLGIMAEGAGKSGFITSLYMITVPLIGLIFGKKTHPIILVSIVLALIGLYAINTNGGFEFRFTIGTLYLLLCTLCYAIQIYIIGIFSPKCNSFHLSTIQFLFTTIILTPFMFIFETPLMSNFIKAIIPLLFCGVMSTGVAFTIQIYAQKNIPTVIACVIMSLESVFTIIFAFIFLKERFSWFQLVGCLLIFSAVIVCQIPTIKEKKKQKLIKKKSSV